MSLSRLGFGRAEPWVFLALWLALAAHFRSGGFNDPGSLWHVVVGDRILADGFMTTDPFTHTHAGKTWIPQQWGAEVAMSLLFRLSGFDGVLLGMCVLLAATGAMLFGRLLRGGMGVPLAAAVMLAGGVAAGFHFVARPHLVTIALTAVVMGWLTDVDRGRRGFRFLFWLVPLGVVWTNIHGGVLAAVATYGLVALLWLIGQTSVGRRVIDAPELSRADVGVLAGAGALFALTPLVNPFGLEMVRTWTRIVGSKVLPKVVVEHMPTPWDEALGITLLGLLALYLFALAGAVPRQFRATWFVPFVWFALSAKGVRQGPLFCAVTLAVIADVWPHTRWYRYFLVSGDTLSVPQTWGRPPAGPAWLIPALLVAGAVGLQVGGVRAPLVGRDWAYLDPKSVPWEIAEPLRRKVTELGPNVVNDANLGGFVVFFARDAKTYMDDRFELFGDDWTERYADCAFHRPEAMGEWAAASGARLAVVARGKGVAKFDEWLKTAPGWKEVASCDSGAIYERVAP